jgi:hypothetical protein
MKSFRLASRKKSLGILSQPIKSKSFSSLRSTLTGVGASYFSYFDLLFSDLLLFKLEFADLAALEFTAALVKL